MFVLAYTGAYEWRRGAGWRRLTGESAAAEGPSFDEMKSVLSDPEWLTDPDSKSMQVAMECLRDLVDLVSQFDFAHFKKAQGHH